jgi:hypothetical protein
MGLRTPLSCVLFPFVKVLIPLLILATPLHAKLLATFHTTQGDVVVELQYDKTPLAVANFIGLAQGTRSWLDEETGAVVRKPFYVGEKFYRVVDEADSRSPRPDLETEPPAEVQATSLGTNSMILSGMCPTCYRWPMADPIPTAARFF